MNLSEQVSTLSTDFTLWLRNNSFDVLLALAIGTGIVFALLALRGLSCKLLERSDGTAVHWRTIFARVIARTHIGFMLVLAAELVTRFATPPQSVTMVIETLFIIASAFQAALWARELVVGYVEYKVGGDDSHSTLGSAVGIIRLLVSVTLFAIAIIVILDNLGVNVTGLVAGLGIGGIAIGLAAKGIFDDLFSALSIIFDKPFRRGETVRFDQTTATVEEIGLKSTRLRSVSGEEVVISNTNLLNKELRNFARLGHRRITQPFGIVYQTDPSVCAGIPDIVKAIVEAREKCVFVRCGMIAFGPSSLDYELQYDVMSTEWQDVFEARHAILIAILERFNRDAIEFAYPTTTNFTAGPDGKMVMPYPPGLESVIIDPTPDDDSPGRESKESAPPQR